MARHLQSPEKELRFTRSGQAAGFWLAAAIFAMAGMTLLACSIYRRENPQLPHPAWAVAPFALAAACARLALRLTRHAYLIFTPLGIEIFPFFRPARTMRLVSWGEIAAADVDAPAARLTLHHNLEKTSGIHLSLKPIRKDRRALLAKAITGRVSPAPPVS